MEIWNIYLFFDYFYFYKVVIVLHIKIGLYNIFPNDSKNFLRIKNIFDDFFYNKNLFVNIKQSFLQSNMLISEKKIEITLESSWCNYIVKFSQGEKKQTKKNNVISRKKIGFCL